MLVSSATLCLSRGISVWPPLILLISERVKFQLIFVVEIKVKLNLEVNVVIDHDLELNIKPMEYIKVYL